MCVVSAVGDEWTKKIMPMIPGDFTATYTFSQLTDQEIQTLREFIRNDLPEFRRMIEEARQYDIDNNEPECQNEEKFELIRKIAKELGIEEEIDFI